MSGNPDSDSDEFFKNLKRKRNLERKRIYNKQKYKKDKVAGLYPKAKKTNSLGLNGRVEGSHNLPSGFRSDGGNN